VINKYYAGMGLAGVKLALFSMNLINLTFKEDVMRKSTMNSYISMIIAFGFGMVVLVAITQLQLNLNKSGLYALQMATIEDVADVEEMADIDIVELEVAMVDDDAVPVQAEIDPDDYDGKIVIATADEVITMTIDDDGTKRFTNHMIAIG